MVGAAFAGAVVDDSVGNYPFFSNGEPNVKIVVGSGAAISDGVAAANLAAMIGNLAYSDSAVTATGGAGSGVNGTVAGKTVTLEVTPQQAQILALADSSATLRLTLRPFAEDTRNAVPPFIIGIVD